MSQLFSVDDRVGKHVHVRGVWENLKIPLHISLSSFFLAAIFLRGKKFVSANNIVFLLILDKVWKIRTKVIVALSIQEQTHQDVSVCSEKKTFDERTSFLCMFFFALRFINWKTLTSKKRQRIFILHTCESLAFSPSLSRYFFFALTWWLYCDLRLYNF